MEFLEERTRARAVTLERRMSCEATNEVRLPKQEGRQGRGATAVTNPGCCLSIAIMELWLERGNCSLEWHQQDNGPIARQNEGKERKQSRFLCPFHTEFYGIPRQWFLAPSQDSLRIFAEKNPSYVHYSV